ncbi:MAG TPA: hypothetical protein PLK94_12225 [Alphaproteobacteria bacterium]|nr:hypothetical protein [Alphaproteobacteria bacterium]HOO52045.1 hypothetical protein [Alphaproteobacteria bacterium]
MDRKELSAANNSRSPERQNALRSESIRKLYSRHEKAVRNSIAKTLDADTTLTQKLEDIWIIHEALKKERRALGKLTIKSETMQSRLTDNLSLSIYVTGIIKTLKTDLLNEQVRHITRENIERRARSNHNQQNQKPRKLVWKNIWPYPASQLLTKSLSPSQRPDVMNAIKSLISTGKDWGQYYRRETGSELQIKYTQSIKWVTRTKQNAEHRLKRWSEGIAAGIKNASKGLKILGGQLAPSASAIILAPAILIQPAPPKDETKQLTDISPVAISSSTALKENFYAASIPKQAPPKQIIGANTKPESAPLPTSAERVQVAKVHPKHTPPKDLVRIPNNLEAQVNVLIAEWFEGADHKRYGYSANGKGRSTRVSCSHFIRNTLANVESGLSGYGLSLQANSLPQNSANIVEYIARATKRPPRRIARHSDLANLHPGDVIGVDSGRNKHRFDNRRSGIDHIMIAYKDPKTQKLMLAESTSRKDKEGRNGVQALPVEDYIELLKTRLHWRFFAISVLPMIQDQKDMQVANKAPKPAAQSQRYVHRNHSTNHERPSRSADTLDRASRTFEQAATPKKGEESRVLAILNGAPLEGANSMSSISGAPESRLQ